MDEMKCPECGEVYFEDMWIVHNHKYSCMMCGFHDGLECPSCHKIYHVVDLQNREG